MDVVFGALPVDTDGFDVYEVMERMASGEPPASAEEYLLRVRLEAESLPEYVSATFPEEMKANQTVFAPKDTLPPSSGVDVCPVDSWENEVLSQFAILRQTLIHFATVQPIAKEDREPVPGMKDMEAWETFLFGSSPVQEDCDEEKVSESHPGTPPRARLLLQFDQVLTRTLLWYCVEWLEKALNLGTLSLARTAWVYALLARVDKPVVPDVAACLRRILRSCLSARANISNPDDETILPQLNLLIVLSSKYFSQGGELSETEESVYSVSR